ncbi:MAG: hypothetical protein ACI9FZ_000353 [Bacteroidia bacterium]|jgi:hypothetical protein
MAPRLCVRSIVVAAALLFCYAIYGRPPSRAVGAELVGRGLGHFPQLQFFCDIPVLFASENSAPLRLCGGLYRGVLFGL